MLGSQRCSAPACLRSLIPSLPSLPFPAAAALGPTGPHRLQAHQTRPPARPARPGGKWGVCYGVVLLCSIVFVYSPAQRM